MCTGQVGAAILAVAAGKPAPDGPMGDLRSLRRDEALKVAIMCAPATGNYGWYGKGKGLRACPPAAPLLCIDNIFTR